MAEQPGHPYYLQYRKKLLAEHRKMAEAGGCEKCDFRFKWGGELPSCWPPPWLES